MFPVPPPFSIITAINHFSHNNRLPRHHKSTAVPSDAFDDFVAKVWSVRHQLPVVEAEIGDTWIYGARFVVVMEQR